MIACEMKGTYTVHFDEMNDSGLVGRIDGDEIPVYVHRDSLYPLPGETWDCSLTLNNGPRGRNYFAILQDRIDDDPAEQVDESKVDVESKDDKEVPVEAAEEETPEDVYVIDEDDDMEEMVVVPRLKVRWSHFVRYVGNNTLHTDMLQDGLYIAYATLGGRKIEIIPHEHGDLECVDGNIQMDGLDRIMAANRGCILGHHEEGDIMVVHLIDFIGEE